MRFQFMGTAAAEGIPALWCECELCQKARKSGGKNIRRRASYFIDDDTIVDFGPDGYEQYSAGCIDMTKIKRVIYTHPHEDHLNPENLMFYRRGGFSRITHKIKIFGSWKVFTRIVANMTSYGVGYRIEDYNAEPIQLHNCEPVTDEDMTIKPFDANHAPGLEPHFLSIARGGKRILIANDTGWPKEEIWTEVLKDKYDMVSIDSTMGFTGAECHDGHMGVNWVVKFADRLRENGCINPDCRIFATHFTHNGGSEATQEGLEKFFRPHNIEVAYDGLVVEF